ncbi:MAG: phosphate ABC transporter ATP-binding protein [Bacillota bacterium]
MNHPVAAVDLRKSYNGRLVLAADEFRLAAGQVTALVGPSGAGKTTLLRLAAGLETPDSGELYWFGRPSNAADLAARRRLGFVFQMPRLFSGTVYENLAYGLRLRGLGEGEIRERVERLLQQVGLSEFSAQVARSLSGGEQQRVALARTLITGPEVIFLDEPTANLDPPNVKAIEELVTGYCREQGAAVAWVTHNIFQARRCSQQLVFLAEGRVVEAGPTHRLVQEAAEARTRAFLSGEMIY